MELDQGADGANQSLDESKKETTKNKKDDTVAYKTYDKAMALIKKREAELTELREKNEKYALDEKTREEKVLESQGEYKKILESRERELKELKEKDSKRDKENIMQLKAGAFLDKLPGKLVSDDYLAFANLDEIAFNPDTGVVDDMSAELAVNNFVKKHARLYVAKGGPSLPNGAPEGDRTLSTLADRIKACKTQKEIDTLVEENKINIR